MFDISNWWNTIDITFLTEYLFIVIVLVNWYTNIYLDTNYYIPDILGNVDIENIGIRL